MPFAYALIPVVGGLIGWVTNVLAIRLLFRPLQPLCLGPIVIHGLIPKRRGEIANAVAETVANELVDMAVLLKQVTTPEMQAELVAAVMRVVEERGRQRMPSFIPEAIRLMIMEFLRKLVAEELASNLPSLMGDTVQSLGQRIDVRAMVVERIEAMELEQLERVVLQLARRELKAIECLGGALGFVIGLMQVGVLALF